MGCTNDLVGTLVSNRFDGDRHRDAPLLQVVLFCDGFGDDDRYSILSSQVEKELSM